MWCGTVRGRERLRSDSDCSVYDEEYRIVVVGAKDVGKTAICQVYVGGREEDDACDRLVIQKTAKFRRAEFCTWDTVDGQTCCMRVSELRMPPTVTPQSGNDDPIVKTLTQRADGFLLMYSVTDMDSFWATSGYYHLIMELRNHSDTPLVFIAHKTDADKCQVVTPSKGRDAAFDIGASFYETSVRSDPDGVKYVFHDVIRQLLDTQPDLCGRANLSLIKWSHRNTLQQVSQSVPGKMLALQEESVFVLVEVEVVADVAFIMDG